MRAVDTNVVVRLIAQDDPRQLAAAKQFVAPVVWISHLVLAEAVWVLEANYGFDRRALAGAVDTLLNHAGVSLQDPDVVAAALAQFRARPGIGFSDCLILEIARKAGHVPLGTFDRRLGKLDGAEHI
jgi:predicted nucleic-acid-binding protein